MVRTKWYGQNGTRKNGIGQMVYGKMVLDKWYGQTGRDKTVSTKSSIKYYFGRVGFCCSQIDLGGRDYLK